MALITTPGAADANSMASLDEALAHIATLSQAQVKGWPTLQSDQEAALRQAATRMNQLDFKGRRYKSEELQPMPFPRYNLYDRGGYIIGTNVIPMAVKRAQIELAIWLWAKNRNTDPAPSRLKLGPLDLEGQSNKAFPDHVLAHIAHFLGSDGSSCRLVRG